jgi:LuxR family maltose regulon positive regulatory protein
VGYRVVQSHSSLPADVGASVHDDILATKVTVPHVRPDLVARPALTERIDDATSYDLCLVCSPPGFGKTTLLAAWAARRNQPVAWLSLDDDDNDPVRFWRYVVAALDRVRQGVGARAATLLVGPGRVPVAAVVTALINDLAARDEAIVLALDDYHSIGSQAVHDGVTFLLGHLPPGLRLVIAGRSDPPLPLADLRAGGRLAELRAADLRFTAAEVAAFLVDLWGLALPQEAVATLAERTEGWVAGLQLAALSLRHQPDPSAFVAAFAGSHRFVLDYLSEEVFARQPVEMRSFLLSTAVLERLSGPLCDAVTGRSDGHQMLEAAERANLFVVPLDEHRRWYRYHHLFADLLRVRLGQECHEGVADLHRRAAAWYESNGLAGDAVHHAFAAGDVDHAVRVIEASVEELIWWRSEGATLERWLAALPREVLRDRPRIVIARALRALVSGRLDEAATLVATAERAPAPSPDEPFVPTVGRQDSELVNLTATIAFIHAFLASRRGDAERADAYARQATEHLAEDDRQLRLVVQPLPAEAAWLAGRLPEAERLLEAVIAERAADEQPHMATRALYDLGQIHLARGRLRAAEQAYRRALAMIGSPGAASMPASCLQHLGLAEVLRQRGDLEAARHHANEGLALCRLLASTEPASAGFATLAWIQHAQGEDASARDSADEAARAVLSAEVVALFNPGPSERARLLLALGEVEEVARWVAGRGLGEADNPNYPREREYLVLARLLLARGSPDRAVSLLRRLHDAALAGGRFGSVIEIRVLLAWALDAASESACALDVLVDALALAQPEGYFRVFVDEGATMATLLHRLLTSAQRGQLPAVGSNLLDSAAQLLKAIQRDRAELTRPAVRIAGTTVLVEPLTEREGEVLLLLAEGRANREIAERLVVTLDTVKKHLTHIFGKLGAVSRIQAVARARELRLLD